MTNAFFESQQQRLARLVTPSDLPPNPVKRHKSSEHQLLPTALVQGTTLVPSAKRSDSVQAASLRLPKLPSDVRLKQFLKRKKIITGLTPRIGRRIAPMYSVDPSENMPPIEKSTGSQSSTSKTFKSKEQPDALTTDFIQKINLKVQHIHHARASCSQSPERTLEEEKEETPRRSFEPEAERPQTLEERSVVDSSHPPSTRIPMDTTIEDLNSSGILMAKKMKLSTQIRSSVNTISEVPESHAPLHLPPKPFIKKRRPKQTTVSLEVKPTPEQSALISACLYSELNQAMLRSNGMTQSISESSYKFYLGPGNNSQLISFLMKRRWFWTRVDTWQQADFIWTQNRHISIVEKLEKTVEPLISLSESPFEPVPTRKRVLKLLIEAERGKSGIALITSSPSYTTLSPLPLTSPICIYNRIERNYQLTTKKRLFLNMQAYYQSRNEDVFSALPLTFLIQEGKNDPEFARFEKYFADLEAEKAAGGGRVVHSLWIVKPGENTNCGHGIHVASDLEEIRGLVSGITTSSGHKRTFIIQKYIEKPLLVNKRKFDIRCYGLLTCFNGHVQGYFYHDGYLRTSSKEFTLKNVSNRFIHLTNDAVQKKSEDYGRFENGNKLSFPEFQRYLEANFTEQIDFWRDLWPRIKQLMTDSFQAVSRHVDPHRRKHTFEILGYDFMIDDQFKVWLIEVNTNPCLSLSSTYLAKVIPAMLDNAFRIAVDPYFSEPNSKKHQGEWASQPWENKFELVFSSQQDLKPDTTVIDQVSDAEEASEAEEEEAN